MSLPDTLRKARDLEQVSLIAEPRPLSADTWNQYVQADAARGSSAVPKLIAKLQSAHGQGQPVRVIFAGHRGCGKSTELARVSHAIREDYAGEVVRVDERYNLPSLDYRQLLFLCADVLMQYVLRNQADPAPTKKIAISDDQLTVLRSWFDEETKKEVATSGQKFEGEAGANLNFLGALFARFSGKIFSGGDTQRTVSVYIERRLDTLSQNMAILVRAIETAIAPRRLLLILEGLDKIESLKQGRDLFIDQRSSLLQIPCSVVFTFPIRLWYEPDGAISGYDHRCLLPMIPVRAAPESPDLSAADAESKAEEGRKTLREIVLARMDESLIARDALDHLVDRSGGVIRDLLYMLRDASLNARLAGRPQISLADSKAASRQLRSDYARSLSAGSEIKVEDIRAVLGHPEDWPRRETSSNVAFKVLLQSLCILEYNGDTWHDLHPLIRDHLIITRADEERRQKRRDARPS